MKKLPLALTLSCYFAVGQWQQGERNMKDVTSSGPILVSKIETTLDKLIKLIKVF